MRVLVTGGAGYVGSRLVAHLLAHGHAVRVFDRLLYGGEALLPLTALPGFDLRVGDVRDGATLAAALDGVEAVIHLAGIVGEPACNVDPAFAWSVNQGAVPTLLQAARQATVRQLLFISTCSNYGVAAPNTEVDEDAPLNPVSDYARAKVLSERAVLGDNDLPVATVLRLGTICGLSARMRFDLLVNEMARDTVLQRPVTIFAPAAWRPFLHIDDAAEAMRRVLQADPARINRRVLNVVGENHQKTGLIAIAKAYRPDMAVSIVDKQPDLRDYRVNGARFAAAIGFRPSRSVASAFREVAHAVRDGLFANTDWPGHSATPIDGFRPH
jgi:nucleoside-diphosphate-sugar epimerase